MFVFWQLLGEMFYCNNQPTTIFKSKSDRESSSSRWRMLFSAHHWHQGNDALLTWRASLTFTNPLFRTIAVHWSRQWGQHQIWLGTKANPQQWLLFATAKSAGRACDKGQYGVRGEPPRHSTFQWNHYYSRNSEKCFEDLLWFPLFKVILYINNSLNIKQELR